MKIRKHKPKNISYCKQSKNGSFHFVEKYICERCSAKDDSCYLCGGSGYLTDEEPNGEHHYAPVADLYYRHER